MIFLFFFFQEKAAHKKREEKNELPDGDKYYLDKHICKH